MFSKSLGTGVCVLLISFCAGAAEQEREPLGVGISADYFSKYVWRGQLINDESVFQPSVYLSKYGFTGSVWGNMDMTGSNDNSGRFTEFDTSVDYTAAMPGMDWLNYSVGAIYYDFPNTAFYDTTEVYGGLSLPKVPLTPSVKIYQDVDEVDGSYVQFGIGHTFEKIQKWSDTCYSNLVMGASVGYGTQNYNNGYALSDDAGFNDLTLTMGLPVCIGSWIVKPSINYAMMLDNEVRENTTKSDNLWAGIGISTSF